LSYIIFSINMTTIPDTIDDETLNSGAEG